MARVVGDHVQICNAKLRNKDRRCTNIVMVGRNRCRQHGGKSLSGQANGNSMTNIKRREREAMEKEALENGTAVVVQDRDDKTGMGAFRKKGSRRKVYGALPERMRDTVNKSLTDPDQLSLAPDIAIIDALIVERALEIDTNESGASWVKLTKLWRSYRMTKNEDRKAEIAKQITQQMKKSQSNFVAQESLAALIAQRAKLVDGEIRRLTAINSLVAIKDVVRMLDDILGSVVEVAHRELSNEDAKKVITSVHTAYRRFIPTH